MKHTLILTLLLILATTSCQHRTPITSVFAEAESLMYTHPDSALKLLQAIPNPEQLTGKAQADYALLMTQAKSRNQIWATSDSLIRIAVDYYQNSDEMGKKAKSLLYLAGLYMDMEQYSKAVLPLKEAEQYMEEVEDPYIQALILNSLSYLNRKAGNYETALTYFKKALHIHLFHDCYEWQTGKLSDIRTLSYNEFMDSVGTYMDRLKKAAVFDFFNQYESKKIQENQHKYDKEVILSEKVQVENRLYYLLSSGILLVVSILAIIWWLKKKNNKRIAELQVRINKIIASSEVDKNEISLLNELLAQSRVLRQEYDQILQLATKQDIEALGVYLRLLQEPTVYSVREDLFHLKHWLNTTSSQFASRLCNQYPNLTTAEINICCLQRLGFSQEKMASIMQVKVGSVNQNIYRTCPKLGLKNDKYKFRDYIHSF